MLEKLLIVAQKSLSDTNLPDRIYNDLEQNFPVGKGQKRSSGDMIINPGKGIITPPDGLALKRNSPFYNEDGINNNKVLEFNYPNNSPTKIAKYNQEATPLLQDIVMCIIYQDEKIDSDFIKKHEDFIRVYGADELINILDRFLKEQQDEGADINNYKCSKEIIEAIDSGIEKYYEDQKLISAFTSLLGVIEEEDEDSSGSDFF